LIWSPDLEALGSNLGSEANRSMLRKNRLQTNWLWVVNWVVKRNVLDVCWGYFQCITIAIMLLKTRSSVTESKEIIIQKT